MDPSLNQDGQIWWDEKGAPHSAAFNDKYFCRENGYEEALVVACEGNSLRQRFSALDPVKSGTFVIMETGFGTGLDFCCAWELWDQCAPPSWKLHFVSVELYPISVEQVERALGLWPTLARYKEMLAAQYCPVPGGIQEMSFDHDRVRLTIVFDHVWAALATIKKNAIAPNGADAWFLDGFAPSKNPEMWSEAVYRGMAALSRLGTTLSTFTVAGHVRRGLEAQGFSVQKIPGYGTKNHVLSGIFKGFKA